MGKFTICPDTGLTTKQIIDITKKMFPHHNKNTKLYVYKYKSSCYDIFQQQKNMKKEK